MMNLSDSAREYASLITIKGILRASKPTVKKIKVPSEKYGYVYEPVNPIDGCAAYVWRMVAFQVSPNPKHQCMPVCAEFDLPGTFDHRKALTVELDLIVEEIVSAVPKHEWHGVVRWGNALGYIGTPQVAPDGAIIYR